MFFCPYLESSGAYHDVAVVSTPKFVALVELVVMWQGSLRRLNRNNVLERGLDQILGLEGTIANGDMLQKP